MREYKFRAWIKNESRMQKEISINPFHVGDSDRKLWKWDEVEVMQYTGLKDSIGKEIYEGDIIQDSILRCYEVQWNDDRCLMQLSNGQILDGHELGIVFVIGNVHENPELMKETE